MAKTKLTKRKISIVCLLMVGLVSLAAFSGYAWFCLQVDVRWQGVTPGVPTYGEVIHLLGVPNNSEVRGNYSVISYGGKPEWGRWKTVEIWTENFEDGTKVVGILLNKLDTSKPGREWPMESLEYFIEEFGRPDKVTWTIWRHRRYLIWPNKGIAISADARTWLYDEWDEFQVLSVLYFKPTNIDSLIKEEMNYPWPPNSGGFSEKNLYTHQTTDAPDLLPEDPYDWSNVSGVNSK